MTLVTPTAFAHALLATPQLWINFRITYADICLSSKFWIAPVTLGYFCFWKTLAIWIAIREPLFGDSDYISK
jgi:hypothetical protein